MATWTAQGSHALHHTLLCVLFSQIEPYKLIITLFGCKPETTDGTGVEVTQVTHTQVRSKSQHTVANVLHSQYLPEMKPIIMVLALFYKCAIHFW